MQIRERERDNVFDIMRGLAMLFMVFGNFMGNLLIEPHPFYLSVIITIVAPMFVMISGTMVALTCDKRNYSFTHYLYRMLIVVGAGVFLEVFIWKTWPFTIFEVLYLIGYSIPLTYLFMKISSESIRWCIIIAIFALTPVLQNIFGYTEYPTEISFPFSNYAKAADIEVSTQTSIINHLFIDGWFPMFPWLAFAFAGANLYTWRKKYSMFDAKHKIYSLVFALVMVALGVIVWNVFPVEMIVRDGYSELFYPPTIGFILWVIGAILLVFIFVDATKNSVIYKPIILFGNAAMFVYLLHYGLLEILIIFVPEMDLSMSKFLIVDILSTIFLFISAYGWIKWKMSLARK